MYEAVELTGKMIEKGRRSCRLGKGLWRSVQGGVVRSFADAWCLMPYTESHKAMYTRQVIEARVRLNGEKLEWFEVKQGVRQGCALP